MKNSDKPIQWEVMASMEDVQKQHPEWTEEQCREEFSKIASAGVEKMIQEMEARKRKRKAK